MRQRGGGVSSQSGVTRGDPSGTACHLPYCAGEAVLVGIRSLPYCVGEAIKRSLQPDHNLAHGLS